MFKIEINSDQLNSLIETAVKEAIVKLPTAKQFPEPDQWFDLTQLCNYHPDRPTKATVYGWIQLGLIPHHKGAKKLRFLKSEIDQWLKNGKRKTSVELQAEANTYLSKNKNGRL